MFQKKVLPLHMVPVTVPTDTTKYLESKGKLRK